MPANDSDSKAKRLWKKLASSARFRDLLLFIPFLVVSAIFWFIVTLNDETTNEFEVGLEIVNLPDSVTFISDPPASLRVNVRDRGAILFRRMFTDSPVVNIDFNDYASGGSFRVPSPSIQQLLRSVFGSSVAVLAMSPDSISVPYTTSPGRIVPVCVVADITPAIGKVVGSDFILSQKEVKVYSSSPLIDTLRYVYTNAIVRRDLDNPLKLSVGFRSIPGCRIEPASIEVTIPVEPLENRRALVDVSLINVPAGHSLMVYPRKVNVRYLTPMSTPDIAEKDFVVVADYLDVDRFVSNNIPVRLQTIPDNVVSATLMIDSVEYSVINR